MDVAEYLPMFLAEAREHLQELNLAVVRIEEEPDDRETVDEIFRIAHSFKGMSATMGFAGIAALTHKMEDVFELLRQRSGGLGRDAVTVVLECLDALETAVDAVEATGAEELDPAALVARLDGLVRASDPAGVARVRARLTGDVAMPGVRAFQILAALSDHGELISSDPAEDDLDGFAGEVVEAFVATEHEHEALAATVLALADVADVHVSAAEAPAPAAPEPAAAAPEPAANVPEPAAATRKPSGTVRVDADRLDALMTLMGELVVHRTRVESRAAVSADAELGEAVQDLTRTSQALQSMVMQVRMVPVESVFMRFPRLVRDLSVRLGKEVDLQLVGKETELDRGVVESLGDPIVHLVRNALDHGFETPAEREAAGKPPTATLTISAQHQGGKVLVEVRDDGRGLDPERIAAIAVERGLLEPAAAAGVDMARAAELLFTPGFSTAESTSDISGRGVGMDAVRDAVRGLGGDVALVSQTGAGTTAQIRLPLTLAIVATLLVNAGGEPFAIPIDRVEHTLSLEAHPPQTVAGRPVLNLRDGVLPLVDPATALGAHGADPAYAVLVRSGEQRFALAVDELLGQRELVTRALPGGAGDRAAVSGGAVLADGGIALVVDCDALITHHA